MAMKTVLEWMKPRQRPELEPFQQPLVLCSFEEFAFQTKMLRERPFPFVSGSDIRWVTYLRPVRETDLANETIIVQKAPKADHTKWGADELFRGPCLMLHSANQIAAYKVLRNAREASTGPILAFYTISEFMKRTHLYPYLWFENEADAVSVSMLPEVEDADTW